MTKSSRLLTLSTEKLSGGERAVGIHAVCDGARHYLSATDEYYDHGGEISWADFLEVEPGFAAPCDSSCREWR